MRRALAILTLKRRPSGWLIGPIGVLAIGVALSLAARLGLFSVGVREPPFFAAFRPDLERRFLPLAIGVLAAAVLVAVGLVWRRLPAAPFVVLATIAGLAARLGLNTARQGLFEWNWPFNPGAPEAHTEYRAALRSVGDHPGAFLDRFAGIASRLPVHPSGHPPGATLAAWAVNRLTDGTSGAEAEVVIALGALGIPLTYLLGRTLAGDAAGRAATLAAAFAPMTLLETVTAWDGVFCVPATLGAALLLRGPAARLAGGAAIAAAAFLSYALPLAAAWSCLALVLRGERRRALLAAGTAAAAIAVSLLVLHLTTGYDPIGAARATRDAYARGIASTRPYGYWLFGAPLAFAIGAGPLLTVAVLRSGAAGAAGSRALLLAMLTACLVGATKGEVERIWLFLVPLAAVGAGSWLAARPRFTAALVVCGALQAAAVELAYATTF